MSNEDYARGYNDGFRAGLEAGKDLSPPNPVWPDYPGPFNPKGYTCKVCGMFFESGKAYGYCCMNSNCPTKITCSSNISYTFEQRK